MKYKDTIFLRAEIRLSFTERVLLLFRPLVIEAKIDCESEPGMTHGKTKAWAARWAWSWMYRGGYGESVLPESEEKAK